MRIFVIFNIFPLLSSLIIARGAIADEPSYKVNGIIPAVFVFGDSVVDTGNNNWFPTTARGNMPQHGKNFEGGKPTGRLCDGKVPSPIFVEELGIKELLPPYLDPTLEAKDFITGVSFGSLASGYDPKTGASFPVLSIQKQFKECIEKLKGIVGEARALEIVRDSLYIIITGGNDIQLNVASSSYIDILLNFASAFLQELNKLGARRIGVFGVSAVGCEPFYRTTLGGMQRHCVDFLNEKAKAFNNSLDNKFPSAKMVYINIMLDLINHPTKYGSNNYDYLFWDSFHFTEKNYRILVKQVLKQHLPFFIS